MLSPSCRETRTLRILPTLIPFVVLGIGSAAVAQTALHTDRHVFTLEDVQGGFDGSTVGPDGLVTDPTIVCGAPLEGSPPCPEGGSQPMMDRDGTVLYPVDNEFGFDVVDFLGASPKTRDSDYAEGWVGNVVEGGEVVGIRVSNAATSLFKVRPPLGTWCAGLGGTAVKCSTEHYSVVEHVLSCHEVIPYKFADPIDGTQASLSFPDGSASFDCAEAELDDTLFVLEGGDITDTRLTSVQPGDQIDANDNTTVLEDIATSTDYSVTLKDDGKPLYRWGTLIKRPNDLRFYARLALPDEWKQNPDTAFSVTSARLRIDHWVTNNPNDQVRPEDMENEGATGRQPSYQIEAQGTPQEVWRSTKTCFEADGDLLGIEEGGVPPTSAPTGTVLRNVPFAVDGTDPTEPLPFSSDLTGGFTNAWYTTVDRDPFEWSYRDPTTPANVFEFVGSPLPDETLGILVSGPRWRLRANKYGQDVPGVEILKDPPEDFPFDCLPPPATRDQTKYEVGARTLTELDLLDFEDVNGDGIANDSPLLTSLGWIDDDGNGVNIPVEPGLSVNGLPLTEDFDLAIYIKGDRKPTTIYSAQLIIEYETPGSPPPPPPVFDLAITAADVPARVGTRQVVSLSFTIENLGPQAGGGTLEIVGVDNKGDIRGEFTVPIPPLDAGASFAPVVNWYTDTRVSNVEWTATIRAEDDVNPANDAASALMRVRPVRP